MDNIQFKKIGDSYFAGLLADIVLEFSQLREHSDGLATDVSATATLTGANYWARVTLGSAQSRNTYVKGARESGVAIDLPGDFATACHMVVKAERLGEPSAPLLAIAPTPENWLVPFWIPRGETTVVYGDGGVGKSMFLLALALSGLRDTPVAIGSPWRMAPVTSVLYLDWESNRKDHEARWWGLVTPTGRAAPVSLHYRPMHRPLTEVIGSVRAEVAQRHIDVVMADSLGPACGAEPEGSDAAVRTMNALRSLDPATRIVTAHVSKMAADQARGVPRPFGSVYVRNLARSTIFVSLEERVSDDEAIVTYTQTKSNNGPTQKATALRYAFGLTGDGETVTPGEAGCIMVSRHEPDLARMGLTDRILMALRSGAQETVTLAKDLGVPQDIVKGTLHRLKNRNAVVPLTGTSGGAGRNQLWGLANKP